MKRRADERGRPAETLRGVFFRPVGDDRRQPVYVTEHPRTLSDDRRFPTG